MYYTIYIHITYSYEFNEHIILFDRFLLKEERPVKKQKTSHGDSSDESQDYRYGNLHSFMQELVSRKLNKCCN